jgi:hypothetical protein
MITGDEDLRIAHKAATGGQGRHSGDRSEVLQGQLQLAVLPCQGASTPGGKPSSIDTDIAISPKVNSRRRCCAIQHAAWNYTTGSIGRQSLLPGEASQLPLNLLQCSVQFLKIVDQ